MEPTAPTERRELIDMLVAVMGEEIRLAVDIAPDTSFDGDLGIDSIEMVGAVLNHLAAAGGTDRER